MTLKIKNTSGLYGKEIQNAVEIAIEYLQNITNPTLRESVRDRLQHSGIIKIRTTRKQDKSCNFTSEYYTDPKRPSFSFTRSIPLFVHVGEITLCMTNIVNANRLPRLWAYIVHEFAHSCGWKHGEDCGVPGVDGCM